jgi:sec-independent protein translocase protein TatB
MFDIGWSEMLVVGVVALVVIGPKELPAALRTAGRMVGKARGIASEFRQHWDDAMREADLDEIRKKAEEATGFGSGIGDVKSTMENLIDPKGEIAEAAKVSETPSIEAPPVVAETAPTTPAPAPETPPRS